jgi:RNA polymerase sigma-70 factor (ECF subfamily)
VGVFLAPFPPSENDVVNSSQPRNLCSFPTVYLYEGALPEMGLKAVEAETDERLLIEAAQRDPRRFGELYENNFDRVYAFVASRVFDRTEAEDLTAEVFHQALANLSQFEWRGTPFIAWLLRIASNALADRWQRRSRHPEVSDSDLPEAGAEDETERRMLLAQLLEELPSDHKLVMVRRFIDQRSIREIALELKRSEGAIKQLQFRALVSLRNRMGENR